MGRRLQTSQPADRAQLYFQLDTNQRCWCSLQQEQVNWQLQAEGARRTRVIATAVLLLEPDQSAINTSTSIAITAE